MPHDVIMPALGMAQDTGLIVSWHKSEGDAVKEGDVLFEVETDKATMEVPAAADGYLLAVRAQAGENVPVGNVIAMISQSKDVLTEETASPSHSPSQAAEASEADLPEGHSVIMPTLGMAQDTGLLVNWLQDLGAKLTADDPLFEVETDKSTMEVAAGADGYLAAILAEAGDNVPTGDVIAIISPEMPKNTVRRAHAGSPSTAPIETPKVEASKPKETPSKPVKATQPTSTGRILASPKARRLALEKGLDLEALRQAGLQEPFHAHDVQSFTPPPLQRTTGASSLTIQTKVKAKAFEAFAAWAQNEDQTLTSAAILARFALHALGRTDGVARVQTLQALSMLAFHQGSGFHADPLDDDVQHDVVVYDLRGSRIDNAQLPIADTPVFTLTQNKRKIKITLQAPQTVSSFEALSGLEGFAHQIETPLRHLL